MSTKESEPKLNTTLVNGATLAWAEWGGCEDPVLLLAHATGFHGRCWDQVVRHLDGFRVVAVDFPGHGRSDSSASSTWDQFGSDITELIVALDLREIVAVGHSFGAHCLIQAAARVPDRFSKLIAIDPVIFDPKVYSETRSGPDAAGHVARRRAIWDSPEQMFESFCDREPFSRWHSEVLRDYCQYGLVPDAIQYRLACAPAFEASIYGGALDVDIHACVANVNAPVTVVRAKSSGIDVARQSFLASPTWPELAGAFKDGEDVYLPEYSHFIPMENPELVASIIQQTRQGVLRTSKSEGGSDHRAV
jgi:pimeloyl-ACP methyl ester carboxylesterase